MKILYAFLLSNVALFFAQFARGMAGSDHGRQSPILASSVSSSETFSSDTIDASVTVGKSIELEGLGNEFGKDSIFDLLPEKHKKALGERGKKRCDKAFDSLQLEYPGVYYSFLFKLAGTRGGVDKSDEVFMGELFELIAKHTVGQSSNQLGRQLAGLEDNLKPNLGDNIITGLFSEKLKEELGDVGGQVAKEALGKLKKERPEDHNNIIAMLLGSYADEDDSEDQDLKSELLVGISKVSMQYLTNEFSSAVEKLGGTQDSLTTAEQKARVKTWQRNSIAIVGLLASGFSWLSTYFATECTGSGTFSGSINGTIG